MGQNKKPKKVLKGNLVKRGSDSPANPLSGSRFGKRPQMNISFNPTSFKKTQHKG